MKVAANEVKPQFMPVKLEIVFENQKELDAFFGVFNHTTITDCVARYGLDHEAIRDSLRDKYHDQYNIHGELTRAMKNL
jgi:hypothetical protein